VAVNKTIIFRVAMQYGSEVDTNILQEHSISNFKVKLSKARKWPVTQEN
jgi:hypothetical protein